MAEIRGLPPVAWLPDSKKVAMVVLEGKRAGLAVNGFVTSILFAIRKNSPGFRACRRFRVKTVAYRLTPASAGSGFATCDLSEHTSVGFDHAWYGEAIAEQSIAPALDETGVLKHLELM